MGRLAVRIVSLLLLSAAAMAAAPEFALPDLEGRTHRLSDYRGKWVVVNYWATWCPPCREEIPELVLFHEKHKDKDAVVLGVNHEEVDREVLADFVDTNLITYPVLISSPDAAPLGPVRGLPSTYLVSPEGRLVARKVGRVTAEDIERFMNESQ